MPSVICHHPVLTGVARRADKRLLFRTESARASRSISTTQMVAAVAIRFA